MSGSVAASATGGTSGTSGTSGSGALSSLGNNFASFLKLLMTQLQNQDPTSPMDANQFTTELVQFTGVQQQIDTNTNLKQLVQLTQSSQVIQSANMLGHRVAASSDHLALQDGSASLRFTMPAAGEAEVAVTDLRGAQIYAARLAASAGANTWMWDGRDSAGNQRPDGAYRVTVAPSGSAASPLPLTVFGRVTGVTQQGSGVQVQLGGLSVDYGKISAVLD